MYHTLEQCLLDLEKNGHLIRITEEVDPYLEMAAIHLKVREVDGPALLFENVKGTSFRAVSNLFGSLDRSKFIFRHTWSSVQQLLALRHDPIKALKNPLQNVKLGLSAWKSVPQKKRTLTSDRFMKIQVSQLPRIHHWPMDGGAFVTLPQVYTEDPLHRGVKASNLGMYRIQLDGNEYEMDKEVGLHYQIHRGIGVHQAKAIAEGKPLKVSCFIGGPPAHTLAAVMPLPEGLSELMFAGLLAGRRFRYSYEQGFCISHDADFVITGEVHHDYTKPEGPFGDHLGYYSLTHPFPVLKIHSVYARPRAIWPFTVVGRPPQEDTVFGQLIHELTADVLQHEIPGVKQVHAVDAAGVHPLLFVIGSERYTPYKQTERPAEMLTIANRVLGTGQLSLAKFLFITAEQHAPLNTYDEVHFLTYILERIDLQHDIHFYTNTTIDTLDYSGSGLHSGSKVVFAAYGSVKRKLCLEVPATLQDIHEFGRAYLVIPGVVAIQASPFLNYASAAKEIYRFCDVIQQRGQLATCPFIVLVDDSAFVSKTLANFIWVTFTRSNPSYDIYGVNSHYTYKHWGCDNVIIDARVKPHHAPPLIADEGVQKNIERLFTQKGSLGSIDIL